MIRRTWRGILFGIATAATALFVLGLVLQFSIRDRVPGFSILYYATPWPVLAVCGGVLALYWHRHRRRTVASGLAAAAFVALGCWLTLDWEWRRPPASNGALRVVLWNADRPDSRLPGDVRWLRAQDADIIAIAERQPRKKNTEKRWRTAFYNYEHVISAGEMLCLIRGEVGVVEKTWLDDGSYGVLIPARVRGQDVTVFQVDINGSPPVNRREPLHQVAEVVGKHRAERLIVLGDFNTPRHSEHLLPLRAEATNAFEAVGNGCAATWPMPLPVLSLDQMWTNSLLRPVRCEHIISWRSDHRPVVAEFDFMR
jgi:endonuclease/exonuclease/phosphatase (EEP) superfamily protein YafD